MEINNVSYQSYVKEKQEAQQIYDLAVEKGESAGQVKVSVRNSIRLSVNVNLGAEEKGVFYLTYEELLVRSRGKYDVVLNVYPGQPVKNLRMEVKINETQPLKFLNRPVLKSSDRLDATEITPRVKLEILEKSAYLRYNPDVSEQRRVASSLETGVKYGLAAQFVVQYDVDNRSPGGQLIQTKTHYAYYYTPDDIPVLPKYVIFIIDTSGSMMGPKLDQLKEALKNILLKLRPEDSFNIINFARQVSVWDVIKGDVVSNHNMLPTAHYATKQNVQRATQIVDLLGAFGTTDIFKALEVGFKLLDKNYLQVNGAHPIVMFSTDGYSTNGIGKTDPNIIINKITPINIHKAGIYSLSLGEDADKDFLNKLSSKNQGKTTHIYEDSDISLQIEKFFETFSSPALENVTINLGTQTKVPTVNKGNELVIVGEKPEGTDLSNLPNLSISGVTKTGPVTLIPDVETETENMKRLWAYLKVKQLLAQRKLVDDKTAITKKALDLALKYSFVTEVTSLVVVKPKDEDVVNPVDTDLDTDFNENKATTLKPMPIPTFDPAVHTAILPYYPPYPLEDPFINLIKQEIPWLNTLLLNNGTILRNFGGINLDINGYFNQPKACTYTDIGMTIHGNCMRLHECFKLFKYITDYSKLDKVLCPLKEKWGVCCPIFF